LNADQILGGQVPTLATGCLQYTGSALSWGTCGGSPAFSAVTAGSNTAALTVGTGGSLAPTGTGTISANQVNGGTEPASAAVLGTNSSSQPVAAATTGSGSTVVLSASPALTTPTVAGFATGSLPTCNSGSKGALAYTTDGTPSFTFCNGTTWTSNGGTLFTMAGTGCTPTAATGDATGGSFTLASGPCTAVTVTFNGAVGMTAGHLWDCSVEDQTLQAAGTWFGRWGQSSSTTTTAVIPIPAAAGTTDVITFSCTPH
jgi:hypothetical protein